MGAATFAPGSGVNKRDRCRHFSQQNGIDRGFFAFEVKRSAFFRDADLDTLRLFRADSPKARCVLLYTGDRRYDFDGIEVLPIADALPALGSLIG